MNAKYDRQASAWAVDRAIETLKGSGRKFEVADVISAANEFCEWMFPKEDEAEDIDPTEAELHKQDAINHGEAVQ